jgi:hypothetical protein
MKSTSRFLDTDTCSMRVFSAACYSSLISSLVSKWRPFSFILIWGNRKVGWVGTIIMLFWSKIPRWRTEYETVHCHDATASSFVANFQGEILAHFHAVTVKHHSGIRIDCLVCQDKFLVNNSIDVKANDEHALDFALHLSSLFRSWWVWTFPVRLILSFLMLFLCCIHREITSRLQIKRRKKISMSTSHVKFCRLTLKIC